MGNLLLFMKKLFIFSLLIFGQINLPIYSKLKTQEDADKFLSTYCIEVVQFIKGTYERQKELSKKGQVGEALRIGGLIQGASQIYKNLCKK